MVRAWPNLSEALRRLWTGALPFETVVWRYAVLWGLVVNLLATGVLAGLLVLDAALPLVVLGFLLPIPYNVVVVVAALRSAESYPGGRGKADLMCLGVVIWMIVLTLI